MTKEEALAKAKEIVNSLTPEEINSIKEKYKEVVDSVIINAQNELDNIEKRISENEQKKRETQDISIRTNLSEENRSLEILINFHKNLVKAYKNGGNAVSITDKRGVEHPQIPNFTEIKTDKIIFDENTILTDEAPLYIPFIDEKRFAIKGYVFDVIRIAKNKYILAVNGYEEIQKGKWNSRLQREEGGGGHPIDAKQGYVLVTLDQLVLINDYYYTKARGIKIKEAKERTERAEKSYDSIPRERRERFLNQKDYYYSLPVAVKKKITKEQYEALDLEGKESLYKPFKKYNPERLKPQLDSSHMWVSFHNMYERFIDPTAMPTDKNKNPISITGKRIGAYGHPEVWLYWNDFVEMMKWKLKDIKVQREIESEIRKIALETSFGESNTNAELKDKYGILVKRQNGSQIQPTEIEQIKGSWISVQKMFGGLSNMAKTDNLKISHTADKFVYASKAAGMYIPSMKTIAVTNKYGNEKFQCIMAHEVAHYIDNKIGEQNGERYSTDNYEGTAGIIASKFRKLLNKKSESDYINATKECFARALEQYFAIETFGESVTYYESKTTGEILYVNADSYISLENYKNTIKPLILKFLEEEKDFFKYLVEFNEEMKNTELQKGVQTETEHLDTFKKVAEGKITPKQAIVETAKTHIAENPNYYKELEKIETKVYPNIKECLLADGDNENDFIVEGTKIYNKEGAEEWEIIGFHKTGLVVKHNPKSKLTNEKGVKEISFDEFKNMFNGNLISIGGINNGDLGRLNVCIKAIVSCMDKIDAEKYKSELEKEVEKAKKEQAESPSKVDMSEFYKIVRESKDFEEAFKKAQSIKGVSPETATYFYSKYNPTGNKSGKDSFKAFYEEVKGVETPKTEPKVELPKYEKLSENNNTIYYAAPKELENEDKYLYRINNNQFYSAITKVTDLKSEIEHITSVLKRDFFHDMPTLKLQQQKWLEMLKFKEKNPTAYFVNKKSWEFYNKSETPKDQESVETMFELTPANDVESLNKNIEQIVKGYANRKMAIVQVEKYLNEQKPLGVEWVKLKGIKTRAELENYINNLQNKLRVGVKKDISEEAKKAKQEMVLDEIENMAIKADKETQSKIEPKQTEEKYDIRKTTGGWAVDKYEYGSWSFIAKFSSKKEALDYVSKKTATKTETKSEIDEAIEMITELLPDLEGEQKQEALDAIEMIKELK